MGLTIISATITVVVLGLGLGFKVQGSLSPKSENRKSTWFAESGFKRNGYVPREPFRESLESTTQGFTM